MMLNLYSLRPYAEPLDAMCVTMGDGLTKIASVDDTLQNTICQRMIQNMSVLEEYFGKECIVHCCLLPCTKQTNTNSTDQCCT